MQHETCTSVTKHCENSLLLANENLMCLLNTHKKCYMHVIKSWCDISNRYGKIFYYFLRKATKRLHNILEYKRMYANTSAFYSMLRAWWMPERNYQKLVDWMKLTANATSENPNRSPPFTVTQRKHTFSYTENSFYS